jgi:hypothetical protein
VSRAGLVPVMALAQRAGLGGLVEDHVRPGGPCGVNAHLKIPCLVAGMAAGADSIDDMDLLWHGAMPGLFGGIRAPSTLGSHLRAFTWGNVRQLEMVNRQMLGELTRRASLLPGKETLAFIDIDAMQKRVYGHRKQGAGFGHTKIQGKSLLVRGLNALAATICTPLGAPVIAATRLRGGTANSARGAARFAAEAISTARAIGCTGLIVVRADSAYYSAAFCGAVRRAGARFSVTVNMDPKIAAAIAAIPGTAWTPICYPRAIWDDQLRCWVSDAEVAEVPYTAFTSKKGQAITARLIVRRVRDLNKQAAGQDELFPAWRYHAVFTDSPFELVQAEEQHRDHAIVEQVFADWSDGPLAHLPYPPVNTAWMWGALLAATMAAWLHQLTGAALGQDIVHGHRGARRQSHDRHLALAADRRPRPADPPRPAPGPAAPARPRPAARGPGPAAGTARRRLTCAC